MNTCYGFNKDRVSVINMYDNDRMPQKNLENLTEKYTDRSTSHKHLPQNGVFIFYRIVSWRTGFVSLANSSMLNFFLFEPFEENIYNKK